MFCHDKHVLVATKVSLSRKKFCRDKIMCVCDKSFVATKMILVAAPAGDTFGPYNGYASLGVIVDPFALLETIAFHGNQTALCYPL